jgi:hypothetical protein
MSAYDPKADIEGTEIPQCSRLAASCGVLRQRSVSSCGKALARYHDRGTAIAMLRTYKEMDSVPMRRKGLERRSKKYAPLQNVSVVNWYMDAEDFHQKGVTKRMSPAAGGKNRIMIYGPKPDGTYIVEFKTADDDSLAISVPASETRVLKYFQKRMPYGLFVPDAV